MPTERKLSNDSRVAFMASSLHEPLLLLRRPSHQSPPPQAFRRTRSLNNSENTATSATVLLVSIIVGALTALSNLSLAVLIEWITNTITHISQLHTDGSWWWFLLPTGLAGLAIGGLQPYYQDTPSSTTSLLKEFSRLQPWSSRLSNNKLLALCVSALLSQAGGLPLGPELLYATVGLFWANLARDYLPHVDVSLTALIVGCTAWTGRGAMMVGPALFYELSGNHHRTSVERTFVFVSTALTCWVAGYLIYVIQPSYVLEQTLFPMNLSITTSTTTSTTINGLQTIDLWWMLPTMGAACGAITSLLLISEYILTRIMIKRRRYTTLVLGTSLASGVLMGLVCVALPSTYGSGLDLFWQLWNQAIAPAGHDNQPFYTKDWTLSTLATMLAVKLLTVPIASSAGLVGGCVTPLLLMGACMGHILAIIFPRLPLDLAVPICVMSTTVAYTSTPITATLVFIASLGGTDSYQHGYLTYLWMTTLMAWYPAQCTNAWLQRTRSAVEHDAAVDLLIAETQDEDDDIALISSYDDDDDDDEEQGPSDHEILQDVRSRIFGSGSPA